MPTDEATAKQDLDKLAAKDEIISILKESGDALRRQNESLDKQVQFRWTFLVFVSGFIPLLFGIAFVYQIYNVHEVQKLQASLQKKTNEFERASLSYSKVLGLLASGDEYITQGYREFERDGIADAIKLSVSAITQLKEGLELTGLKEETLLPFQLKWGSCEPVLPQAALPSPDKSSFTTGHLRPSVINALFNAHDLHARAIFFSDRRSMDTLYAQGRILLGLDPNRWEGYHWVGLAQLSREPSDDVERNTLRASAVECFTKSIALNEDHNRDLINLAELKIAEGRFNEGNRFIREYILPEGTSDKDPPIVFRSAIDSIAYFYLLVSEEEIKFQQAQALSPEDKKRDQEFNNRFLELHLNLKGTFSFTTLEEFIKRNKIKTSDPIFMMYDCLKNRICDKVIL